MGRKQKERQKKKNNQKLIAAATATATSTASLGNAAGGNNSATAVRSSSVTDVDVYVDIGAVAAKKWTTMGTATMATCYHGSTAENVAKGSNFQMALDEWLAIFMNWEVTNPSERRIMLTNFYVKQKNLMKNPEFSQCVFAVGTDMFKKNYGSDEFSSSFSKWMVQNVLTLGIRLKYGQFSLSFDREKSDKYSRDNETDRGIINILDRETNTFCNCMKPYKEEAKKMEKVGICYGCNQAIPKMQLKRCSRCLSVQYCNKECMKNDWPTHKQLCRPHNEQTSEE